MWQVFLLILGIGLPQLARSDQECAPPEHHKELYSLKRLQQALESFRTKTEHDREAMEDRRRSGILGRNDYRESMARYRENIAAYRAGIRANKPLCPYATNEIFAPTILPFEVDERYGAKGNDAVHLRFAYYYTGDQGSEVSVGAITLANGESNGYWAYVPHPMVKGFNMADVLLLMDGEAPDYRSDTISVEMYINNKNVFYKREFPYIRDWRRHL